MQNRPKDAMLGRIYYQVMPEVYKLAPDFPDVDAANAFFKKLRSRAPFTRRMNARFSQGPQVDLFPAGIRFAGVSAQRCTAQAEYLHQYLSLADGRHNPMEVLHILAHVLQPDDGTLWHGAGFAQAFFDLVELVYDKDVRRHVKDIFIDKKIRTATRSPATREKQRDRYYIRKGQEAKNDAQALLREIDELTREHGRGR